MKKAILSILLFTSHAFAGNVDVTDLGVVDKQYGTVEETLEIHYYKLHVEKDTFVEAHMALQSKCNELGSVPMTINVIDVEKADPYGVMTSVTALCLMRY